MPERKWKTRRAAVRQLVPVIVEVGYVPAAAHFGCARITICRAVARYKLRPLIDAKRCAAPSSPRGTARTREQLAEALTAAGGNIRRALGLLGLNSRNAFYKRIRREGLEDLVDRLRAAKRCA